MNEVKKMIKEGKIERTNTREALRDICRISGFSTELCPEKK